MVGSGERFNAAVTVTCTVGLVIVLQRMRALQRQVDALAELSRGHETSLQWLTQRMETPVISASADPASSKGLSLPPSVSRGISRQDSWQSSLEGGGYETATEELLEEPQSAGTTPKKPAEPRPATAEGGGVSGGGVSDADAANKWSCVTMQHGGPPSCGPSAAASSDTLRATASAEHEHLSIASVPPSPAAPRTANDPESAGAVLDALKQALHKADQRYAEQRFEEAHALLLAQLGVGGAEVQWRLARICKELAQVAGATGGAAGKAQERELLLEGLRYATAALGADDAHFATHKWYAILVSLTSGFEGTKATIHKSFVVKEHFERAIELNPSDATSRHLLGLWYYEVAGLSWTMRKVAAAIFASPPTGTYAEAKEHFATAETTEPGFYVKNRLMLGKCHLQLNERAAAAEWFARALELPAKTVEDEQTLTEARRLLNETRR